MGWENYNDIKYYSRVKDFAEDKVYLHIGIRGQSFERLREY